MKNKKTIFRVIKYMYSLGMLIVFFVSSSLVHAATTVIPSVNDETYGSLGKAIQLGTVQLYDLPKYAKYISEKLVWIAVVIAIIMVIVSGYKWIANTISSGDAGDAKAGLLNIVKGLGVVICAWMIIDFIIRFVTG